MRECVCVCVFSRGLFFCLFPELALDSCSYIVFQSCNDAPDCPSFFFNECANAARFKQLPDTTLFTEEKTS